MKQRIFIPGKITDHNLLGPDYIANLQMSGSPEMVRAWLEGDWDVVAGAYFRNSRAAGMCSSRSTSRGLAALHRDRLGLGAPVLDRLVRDRAARDAGAHGDRRAGDAPARRAGVLSRVVRRGPEAPGPEPRPEAPVEEWAAGVLKRSRDEEIAYDVVDTQMFAEDGGPSQAERAARCQAQGQEAASLRKADKQRLPGWNQVRGAAARRRARHEGPADALLHARLPGRDPHALGAPA
jgi:hypothetical protein